MLTVSIGYDVNSGTLRVTNRDALKARQDFKRNAANIASERPEDAFLWPIGAIVAGANAVIKVHAQGRADNPNSADRKAQPLRYR